MEIHICREAGSLGLAVSLEERRSLVVLVPQLLQELLKPIRLLQEAPNLWLHDLLFVQVVVPTLRSNLTQLHLQLIGTAQDIFVARISR